MRRARRQRPPADLSDYTWAELTRLADAGTITWADVNQVVAERVERDPRWRAQRARLEAWWAAHGGHATGACIAGDCTRGEP